MSAVPKIIMQTWKTHEVPEKWKTSPEAIRRLLPDYNLVLMSDDDNLAFVTKYFPDFLPHFIAYPHPIQRADAIRYMWLYKNGGVYMDLDILLLRPLPDLSSADLWLSESSNVAGHLTNSIMASRPNHPFWLAVLEEMKKNKGIKLGKHIEVMTSTGPAMIDRVVKRGKWHYSALPSMPCSVCDKVCKVGPGAVFTSLEGGSWNGSDTKFWNTLLCNWRPMLFFLLLAIVIAGMVAWAATAA